MTAFADIALADGTATNRVFSAKAEIDGKWTWWYQKADGIALGFPSIRTKTLFSRGQSGVTKHEVEINIPVLDTTIPGSPKTSHFHRVNLVVTTSDKGTLAERKDVLAFTKNLLAHARMTELIENLDPPR